MTLQTADPAVPSTAGEPDSGARIVVQAWIASRGLIALVALVLALAQRRSLTEMVTNWDVQHFTRLADGGYLAEPDNILMAFFPGLPLLLSLFSQLGVPAVVSGVIVSTGCSAIAAAALYRLGGAWAAVAWLFAPTAVFTTVPYTESLFCAAAFWAWERARADRWVAATALTALACTVRVSGVFLIGALLVMIITSRIGWWSMISRAALLLVPAGVVAAFAAYLHLLTGSWIAWYTAQSTGWVRGLTLPWDSFLNTIPAIVPGAYADHPWWAAVFRAEMVSMFVGLLVVVWCIVVSLRKTSPGRFDRLSDRDSSPERFNELSDRDSSPEPFDSLRTGSVEGRPKTLWAEGSWVGVQVLAFSLSYWFFSVNRATLLWFPLWMMLGWWAGRVPSGRTPAVIKRTVVGVAFGVEICLMIWWSWLFFTGHWAS